MSIPDAEVQNGNHKKSFSENIIHKHATYYRSYDKRGKVYVLNNTKKDTKRLNERFRHLGFHYKEFEDKGKFSTQLKNYRSDDNAGLTEDYCIVIVLIEDTHQDQSKKFKFYDEAIRPFHADQCEKMKCKPKLFFHLQIPKNSPDNEKYDNDLNFVYKMPIEADLLIYQDKSSDSINNLCSLLQNVGEYDQDVNFQNEIVLNSANLKNEPTIHQTLTRRLQLGHKKIVSNKKNTSYFYNNTLLTSNLSFIEKCIDEGRPEYSHILRELNLDPIKIRNEISKDPFYQIADIKNILEKLGEFIEKHLQTDDENF